MFFKKKDNHQEMAEQLVKLTNLQETLDIIKQGKHTVTAGPREELKIILAVSTCNLVQTMHADLVAQRIDDNTRDEIIRHFMEESLHKQDLVRLKSGPETETIRREIMEIVKQLQEFWKEDDDPDGSGPGPRYYCVKEMLRRLGGQPGTALHDALFELMYLRHKYYIDFFRKLLAQP